MHAEAKPATTGADPIVVTLDSTFIRSFGEGERHLEVRIGNVETASGRRQVFGAVYNGTLGTAFGQRFHTANDASSQPD